MTGMPKRFTVHKYDKQVRDGPFDIQGGGGWDFFEKNSLFPNMSEKKNVSNEVKNKKFVLHSVNFSKPFPWEL